MDELELYLNLVHRLERKIKTIRNTIGLDQGVLSTADVNPIEYIEKYYTSGELPSEDDSILANSDKHIIELRKFLEANPVGSKRYNFVSSIPAGKWNYLPKTTILKQDAISLVRVSGHSTSGKKYSEIFFINVDYKKNDFGPSVSFVDYTNALDCIKTIPEDNERLKDTIAFDRNKIWKRVKVEASRQFSNPSEDYKLTPQYEKALNIIARYINNPHAAPSEQIDLWGIIKRGITTKDLKKKFEDIAREINKEQSQNGSLYATTINNFEKIFKEIRNNIAEEKAMDNVEEILNYAKQ